MSIRSFHLPGGASHIIASSRHGRVRPLIARTPSLDAWLMAPILVYVDDRAVVMLPNRDIEVGTFTPGSELVVTEKATPSGPDFDARIMPSSDVPPDQDKAEPRSTE
jgi:hypothetical protein